MNTASVPECKCSLRTRLVGDGCSICNPELDARIAAENEAEDRLHEAAEDMLAALQAMSAHYSGSLDYQPAYVKMGRAAIAKATGAHP